MKSGDFFFSTFYILAPNLSRLALPRSTTTLLKSAAQAMEGRSRSLPACGMRPLRPILVAWLMDVPPASQCGPWVNMPPAPWRGPWADGCATCIPAWSLGECATCTLAWSLSRCATCILAWIGGCATCIPAWPLGGCATCIPARSPGGCPHQIIQVAKPKGIHSQWCLSTGSAHPTCRLVRLQSSGEQVGTPEHQNNDGHPPQGTLPVQTPLFHTDELDPASATCGMEQRLGQATLSSKPPIYQGFFFI